MAPSLVESMQEMFLLNIQGRYTDGVVALYRALAGSRFPFDEIKFRALAEPIMAHGHNAYAGHGDAIGASPSRLNRLADINLPTLVIHGTEDPILPLDHGMALADNIAGATTLIMEGVGHEIPEALMPEIVSKLLALFQQTSK